MSFYIEFLTNLFAWTRDTTELPQSNVIQSPSNGDEPVGNYVAIDISTPDQVGGHYTTTYARNEHLGVTVIYNFTTRFFFVGDGSAALITEFNNNLNNVVYLENLQRLNISLMSKSQIRKIPIARETKQTQRYYIDCVFSVAAHTSQEVDVIERIVFTDILGHEQTIS